MGKLLSGVETYAISVLEYEFFKHEKERDEEVDSITVVELSNDSLMQHQKIFKKIKKSGGSIVIYIGIDPGKSGALAIIEDCWEPTIIPFSADGYKGALEGIMRMTDNAMCCLERVGAMPSQGVNSMFHFGENYGFIQGLLTAYYIPYELVTPNKWKKEFQVTGDKNSSIAVCKRLFPNVGLRRTDRCRKDDDNMAEALLMAEYARRRL